MIYMPCKISLTAFDAVIYLQWPIFARRDSVGT